MSEREVLWAGEVSGKVFEVGADGAVSAMGIPYGYSQVAAHLARELAASQERERGLGEAVIRAELTMNSLASSPHDSGCPGKDDEGADWCVCGRNEFVATMEREAVRLRVALEPAP